MIRITFYTCNLKNLKTEWYFSYLWSTVGKHCLKNRTKISKPIFETCFYGDKFYEVSFDNVLVPFVFVFYDRKKKIEPFMEIG